MNYLIDKDPTLPNMRWAVIIMWAVAASVIIAVLMQPTTPNTLLKPIVYPLNGAILHSEYVPGEIK